MFVRGERRFFLIHLFEMAREEKQEKQRESEGKRERETHTWMSKRHYKSQVTIHMTSHKTKL